MATTPKPVRFNDADPAWPALARAASLSLAIMSAAKVTSWDELAAKAETDDPATSRIELLPEQADLLDTWSGHLAFQRLGEAKILLNVCPECQTWGLQGDGAAPSRCTLTRNCPGRPVRAKAVTRVPAPKKAVLEKQEPSTGQS